MGSSVNRNKHLREKEPFLHSEDECYGVKANSYFKNCHFALTVVLVNLWRGRWHLLELEFLKSGGTRLALSSLLWRQKCASIVVLAAACLLLGWILFPRITLWTSFFLLHKMLAFDALFSTSLPSTCYMEFKCKHCSVRFLLLQLLLHTEWKPVASITQVSLEEKKKKKDCLVRL